MFPCVLSELSTINCLSNGLQLHRYQNEDSALVLASVPDGAGRVPRNAPPSYSRFLTGALHGGVGVPCISMEKFVKWGVEGGRVAGSIN